MAKKGKAWAYTCDSSDHGGHQTHHTSHKPEEWFPEVKEENEAGKAKDGSQRF